MYGKFAVFEGDPVQCPACDSIGVTECVQPYMPNTSPDGRQCSLDGDLCRCKCSPPPRSKQLDKQSAINFRKFGEYYDVMDDLCGSLFKGNLKIAVVGKTEYSWMRKENIFEIEKLAVYMRDTYDFNAEPLTDTILGLGVWSRDRVLTKLETLDYRMSGWAARAVKYPNFVPVHNTDFRRWQKTHDAGGDFYVFSDVLWISPRIYYVVL